MKAAYFTLGCKVNQYDTQTMCALLEDAGYETVSFEETADVYLINTCTVTAISDKKSRQMIARAHRRNPQAVIVVSGCYAQKDAEKVLSLPGVSLALGNQNRDSIVPLIEKLRFEGGAINAVEAIGRAQAFEDLPARCEDKTRAHLKIQDGCNRYCSYCIIPFVRGKVRSRSLEGIEKEVSRLCAEGFAEFVLTGIHLSSYGLDTGQHLLDAIQTVHKVDGVKRIRLGSLEPLILTEEFLAACANMPKLCRQFHISLQSGSDQTLKRMNRRYDSKQFAAFIANLRKYMPDVALTTDLIAGFPGESLEEHQASYDFAKEMRFARMHVFPYSVREGTAAAKMTGQLDKAEKERRAGELIELGKEMELAFIDGLIGSEDELLIEESRNGFSTGYTKSYVQVQLAGEYPSGTLLPVRFMKREGDRVLCECV